MARTVRYCTRSDAMNMNLSVSTFKTNRVYTPHVFKSFQVFKSEKMAAVWGTHQNDKRLEKKRSQLPATIWTDKVLINRSKTKL